MNDLVLAMNHWAQQAAKRAELAAAAIVVAIVFMLVLPMPIWLLDVLIAVNLCASGLIVVVSMYMPGPTAFSTFPAVLLLTTLFRLAIEVSTTRLILLEADAGHIVETFGNFVVGGNIVVGLVVFLILTVVQFLVITKGSERVSEVTARFTLDAMPGKQMSIDSDLRAGLISPQVAKQKRSELERESQLHGAMDGAMKFVKGDAIAGIFIVVVNLIGGIAIGVMQRGLAVGEAGQLYSVLTIGDALIAQIPSLLISLTAGMITTRVSNEPESHSPDGASAPEAAKSNVGQQIVQELTSEPKALLTAAVIMLIFGLVPGMPTGVFMALAALLAGGGCVGLFAPRIQQQRAAAEQAKLSGAQPFQDATSFRATRPLQLWLPPAVKGTPEAEAILLAVRRMRNRVLQQRGIPDFPMLDVMYDEVIGTNTVQFRIVEVPMVTSRMRLGWGCTTEPQKRLERLDVGEIELEEAEGSRRRRCWLKPRSHEALQEAGIVWDRWEEVLAADIEVELLRNCQMFLGIQEAQRFHKWADVYLPDLGKELGRSVSIPRTAEILQRLAREGVSLRNVRMLLETILEWTQRERDPDVICDQVRMALRRQLCHSVAKDGLIQALLLSPSLEESLRGALRRTASGDYLDLDQDSGQRILDQLAHMVGTGGLGHTGPILLTPADIRRALRRMLEDEFFSVPVLAYTELSQHFRIQPVGQIEI